MNIVKDQLILFKFGDILPGNIKAVEATKEDSKKKQKKQKKRWWKRIFGSSKKE